jgi:hypothetical protein
MASFAITTVLFEDRIKRGTGRYCRAVKDATMAEGCDECMDMESLLCTELGDLGRSLIGKYPLSVSSRSAVIMIKSSSVKAVSFVDYEICSEKGAQQS